MELIENMCARIMGITGPWFESALWISLAIVALFEAIHYWKYVRWKRIRGGANYRTFVRVVSWVHLLVGGVGFRDSVQRVALSKHLFA